MVLNSGTHPCYMFLVFHRRMSTLQPVNRCLQKYPNIEGLAVRNYQVVQTWTFCCPTFNLMFSWNKQCLRKITWGIQNPPCSQHCHCSAWIPLDSFYQCVSSHRHNFCNLFFFEDRSQVTRATLPTGTRAGIAGSLHHSHLIPWLYSP